MIYSQYKIQLFKLYKMIVKNNMNQIALEFNILRKIKKITFQNKTNLIL